MNSVLDIRWRLARPGRIPLGHQYCLLAALCRIVPSLHATQGIGIHPIMGLPVAPGILELTPNSAVTIRSRAEFLPALLPLSGMKLELGTCPIRLGVPEVFPLVPCRALWTRSATIKGYMEPAVFYAAVRRQLDALAIRPSIRVDIGPRRVVEVRRQRIVGFQVALGGLSDDESLLLQARGIGGRRHLGCGLFIPNSLTRSERSKLSHENTDTNEHQAVSA